MILGKPRVGFDWVVFLVVSCLCGLSRRIVEETEAGILPEQSDDQVRYERCIYN